MTRQIVYHPNYISLYWEVMSVDRIFYIYIYEENGKDRFYFKGRRLNYDSDNVESWRHLFQNYFGPFDNFEDLKENVVKICKTNYCRQEMIDEFIQNGNKKQQATSYWQ